VLVAPFGVMFSHQSLLPSTYFFRSFCRLKLFLSFVKGFCAEDLNVTECDGEGATEFVDIEGGGFDEGTGATNVSKDCQDLKDQVTTYAVC